MKSDKGFTITEALVSVAVLIIICTALLPLLSFVTHEKEVLSQKRIITHKLHDELQAVLQVEFVPVTLRETIELADVIFTFKVTEEKFIQGCATWKNIMNRQEEVCLYGISEK